MMWFASLCVVFVSWLFSAWMFMLTVGVVHAEWLPQLPTVGYSFALLLGALVGAGIAVRTVLTAFVTALLGGDS